MKILALETIGVSASVALLEKDAEVQTFHLDASQRSTQALVPAVQKMLAEVQWTPQDIELVAVVSGPGSFTGLRVGITFAKTFAYSVAAELLAIPTLEVLAAGTPSSFSSLSIALDAQRGEVVAQNFAFASEGWTAQGERYLERLETWAKQSATERFLSGPILARFVKHLPPEKRSEYRMVPPEFWNPDPVVLGRLAWSRFQNGERGDLWNILPIYSRLAAAEERRNAAKKA